MKSAKQLIEEANKIVIKLGSNTISGADGKVNRALMSDIIRQVCALIRDGKRVILVSSGAGICGVSAINKWSRKGDINYKQALCAIGQVELMNMYKELFGEYGIHVAQILLTSEDFHDHTRELNIRNAMFTLVDEGVVPIINENDSVRSKSGTTILWELSLPISGRQICSFSSAISTASMTKIRIHTKTRSSSSILRM